MATYSNVSDLYSAVQAYMGRNETGIINKIPLWVSFAEDELDRRLRHPAAITTQEYTVSGKSSTIPAPESLLELKSITQLPSLQPLLRRSFESLFQPPYPTQKGMATAFASHGGEFILNEVMGEDTVFQVSYYASPLKLSTNNPENLYLSACGDFLLFTALAHGFAYDTNAEESQYYKLMAEAVLSTLSEQIQREDLAGSTLVTFANSDYLETYY